MKFLRLSLFSLFLIGHLAHGAQAQLSSTDFLKKHNDTVAKALTAWYEEFILDGQTQTLKMEADDLQLMLNAAFLGTVLSWLEIQVRADIRRLTYLQWQLRKQAQTYEEKQQTLKYLSEVVTRLKPLTLARTQAKKTWLVCVEELEAHDDENVNHAAATIQDQISSLIRAWLQHVEPTLNEALEKARACNSTAADTFTLISKVQQGLIAGDLPGLKEEGKNRLVRTLTTMHELKDASEEQIADVDISHTALHEYSQGMLALNYRMFTYYYALLYKTATSHKLLPCLRFDANGIITENDRLVQLLPEPSQMLTPYVNQLISDALAQTQSVDIAS